MAGYDSILGYGTSPASVSTGVASPADLLAGISGYSSGSPVAGNYTGIGWIDPSLGLGPNVSSDSGFGLNMDTAKLGLSGLATLGNLYAAFQANKLANKQYDLTKKTSQANLTNSIQSYNTTLADRLNSRGKVEGTSADQVAAEIAANSLKPVTL